MSKKKFIKLNRSKELEELMRRPECYMLLSQIALRARRTDEFNVHNLQIGEALVGDYKSIGLTERSYRTAKKRLAEWKFATFKATNKGTIAKLMDTRVFDINSEQSDEQNDEQKIRKRRTKDDQVTTNKNEKNILLDKSNNINEIHFEEFWKTFSEGKINTPLGSKKKAMDIYGKCLKKTSPDSILEGLKNYLNECQKNNVYTAAATTFLNQERYNDYAESKESLEERKQEKEKAENEKRQIVSLFKIDKNDPNFRYTMDNINFLGKDSEKINFSCERQNKKIFVTDTKFNRDWIDREYGMEIKRTLGDYKIIAKEEYKTYFD